VSEPKLTPEAEGPGHLAAREAQNEIEEALFSFSQIPGNFDRYGLRDRLLRAILVLYTVRDNPVIAIAHFEGLRESSAIATECAALLARSAGATPSEPLQRAVSHLENAAALLRRGAEVVAQIQLTRRTELVSGLPIDGPPPEQPFCASVGVPNLHAPSRRALLPLVLVEPAANSPAVAPPSAETSPPPALPPIASIEDLKAFAAEAKSGALARRFFAPPPAEAAARAPELPPLAYEPAIEEIDLLRQLARDCLEDIANLRNLRKPNALESWLDQEPFEQRLLDNLDAFAALGSAALPMVALYHAEADSADPERAFATALTLGSIAGSDTIGAALMALEQSAPETFPGWVEGFALAPNPAIDLAMADLCATEGPELIALALDVLHARGASTPVILMPLVGRPEPPIALRVARALATLLSQREALDQLEYICATTTDDEVFNMAVESLLRLGYSPAIDLLRRTADAQPSSKRGQRALELLALVGHKSDLERLLSAARTAPTVALVRALGRFGHVESLDALIGLLSHENADIVTAAAEALERITGAGLRETVEEPWEIELPPEAAGAGALPIPPRKVERVVTDPAQWSAWVSDEGRHLDPQLKTRAGLPFTPSQIVDELEARATPPDRREEAALELALVTRISSPFSPHDWVARQKTQLTELRDRIATLHSAPGVWPRPRSSDFPGPPMPDEPQVRAFDGTTTLPGLHMPLRPVLPFVKPAPSPPSLTLEQYASLCAELALFRDQAEAIFSRHGLAFPPDRMAVDLFWQDRLRRNPTEYRQWKELYQRYRAYWASEAQRRDEG